MMTIPADVVREFRLTKGQRLKVTYQDAKLIVELNSPNTACKSREANVSVGVAA